MNMHYILAEDVRLKIDPFLDRLKSKFPSSSIIYCGKENIRTIKKIIDKSPPFTKGWLIICNSREASKSNVEMLCSGDNTVVFTVNNKDRLDVMFLLLTGIPINFKVIDNLKPEQDRVVEHIAKELNIDTGTATYIYNRHRGYIPKIVDSINRLSLLPVINKKVIKQFTEASMDFTWFNLFEHIIGVKRASKISKVYDLLNKWQRGLGKLRKFLLTQFEFYMRVQELVLNGELTSANYKDYRRLNSSEFEEVSDFKLLKAIESVDFISYEKLFLLYLMYKEPEKITMFDYIRILELS